MSDQFESLFFAELRFLCYLITVDYAITGPALVGFGPTVEDREGNTNACIRLGEDCSVPEAKTFCITKQSVGC